MIGGSGASEGVDGKGIKLVAEGRDAESGIDEKEIERSLELTFASETVQVGEDFLALSFGMK